jgi:hypothetical protein
MKMNTSTMSWKGKKERRFIFEGVQETLDMSLKKQRRGEFTGAVRVGGARVLEVMLVMEVGGILRNVTGGPIVKTRGLGLCAVLVCD